MQDDSGRRAASELLFLDRGPLVLRAAIVAVVAAGSGVAGTALLHLHTTLAARLASGAALNPFQALVAAGSSWRTVWPGWLAAAFFLIALIRLRRGPLEPPPGRRRPEQLTTAQLRRGLRNEYRAVRIVLVFVSLVAAVDTARAAAFGLNAASGNRAIAPSLPPTIVEALGFVAAAFVLGAWAWTFGGDVRRLGAL